MIGAVDLTDLDMWVRGVPYDEFARLRLEAPVTWFPDEGSGFWSVHRYADIVAASRDVATFSSSRGVSFEEPTDEDMAARRTIIDTDPPEHTTTGSPSSMDPSRAMTCCPGCCARRWTGTG
jgi:cytochrome P450